ncbi:MAG: DUF1844 domain-containing protein [Desulfovibrio sp.]|jgi:hypothetical protein|nr:DUF1844 domain-containing protein [Desulfovibrio sp.]
MDHNNSDGRSAGQPPLPEVTFSTFILSLGSTALAQLGEVPFPESGRTEQNLLLARHSIDVLEMLAQKTRGGLDDQERRLIDGILYELHMKYVLRCGENGEKCSPEDGCRS